MNPLIAEARLVAPHTEDGFLLLRLANALEAAEKMAEAAMEDLADGSTQDGDDADPARPVTYDAQGTVTPLTPAAHVLDVAA